MAFAVMLREPVAQGSERESQERLEGLLTKMPEQEGQDGGSAQDR